MNDNNAGNYVIPQSTLDRRNKTYERLVQIVRHLSRISAIYLGDLESNDMADRHKALHHITERVGLQWSLASLVEEAIHHAAELRTIDATVRCFNDEFNLSDVTSEEIEGN